MTFSIPLNAQSAAASTTKTAHRTATNIVTARSPAAGTSLRRGGSIQTQLIHPALYRESAAFHYVHGRLMATMSGPRLSGQGRSYARWGGGMSCVPYARSVSGIDVAGNAWQWWDNAAGRYARGNRPEPGSVLSFTANGRMRMGHVAVVSRVVNSREVEVDQANWWGPGMRGGVSHGMPVVDVSPNNDWTAVRVGLGQSGEFGSVYPTNGFIYNRPDDGHMVAAVSSPAPAPALNPAPADLRPWAQRADFTTYDEVAEAPAVHTAARRHTTRHTHLVAQH